MVAEHSGHADDGGDQEDEPQNDDDRDALQSKDLPRGQQEHGLRAWCAFTFSGHPSVPLRKQPIGEGLISNGDYTAPGRAALCRAWIANKFINKNKIHMFSRASSVGHLSVLVAGVAGTLGREDVAPEIPWLEGAAPTPDDPPTPERQWQRQS